MLHAWLTLLAMLLLGFDAHASRTINSVTLNNASSVTVTPGDYVTLVVNVTTDNGGGNSRWRGTGWAISDTPPSTFTCWDHTNFDSVGTYSANTTIQVPTVPGTYNAYFVAYSNSGCSQGDSTPTTVLASGVIVVASFLTKTASVTSAPADTNFSFTLDVSNGTASTVNGVVITDDLGTPGLTFVSCSASTGSCSYSGGVVTWSVGNVAAGASASATLTVYGTTAGAKTNTAVANTTGNPSASATVQIYKPLADWRMDEASWNGTANEVRDSSGNNYHGRARISAGSTSAPTTLNASPAYTSGSFSTCRYGELDKTTAPARTNSYVELTGIPPLPSSFTFAAWIRSTNPSQSGQRILVRDDAQDGWGFSLGDPGAAKVRFFNRNIQNSGAVTGDGSNPNCGVFCLDTAAVITANNWFFVAVAIDTTGKRVTHYVYNAAGTLVSNTSSAFSGTWADGSGTAALGGETSASDEGRTADFHFKGNIDEVQIYSGVLSQSDLNVLRTRTRNCGATIDHVEFVHDGAALTCTPKAVTVLGCTSATSCNGVAANQTSGSVTFTPTAISGAQWCSDGACSTTLSGSTTVANGTVIYLREPTARTDVLAGTASAASTTAVQCKNTANGQFNSTSACNVDYAAAGFLMNATSHYACTAQTITIQAVKSSATGTACVPAFQSVNRSLSLHSTYGNPSSGTRQASLRYVTSAGGATSSIAALPTTAPGAANLVNLYFDSTGTATLNNFLYSDVGLMTLQASYTGSSATNDNGLSMAAVSGNTFVTAPKSFVFSGIPTAPLTAGTPFNVTLTAMNACTTATTTPNFGKESTAAAVTLTSTNPQPAVGNSTAVNQTVSGFGTSPNPAATASTNVTWKEVGTVDLVATTSNYLSSSLSPSSTQSSVGRFKPAYFDTVVTTTGCGTFTYSGQPVQKIDVTARATGGTTTANYAGSTWAKDVTLTDGNGGTGTWANNTILATAFASGVGSSVTAAYTFATKDTAPTPIKIRASEPTGADGVSSAAGSEANTSIRSGRVRLLNAYGSERLDLPMAMRAEYWGGSGWQANVSDTCTTTTLAFSAVTGATDIRANTCVRDSANPGASGMGCTAPAVAARQFKEAGLSGFTGDFNLWLQAPQSGGGFTPGAFDVTAAVPVWLQFPWASATATNPTARATFGIFKSPLIYRRENY